MFYCPSQDWDRYCEDQEAGEIGRWVADVSKKIAAVDPYWNWEKEVLHAIADEDEIVWGCGIKVTVPYNEDLESDDVALIVRTLSKRKRELKVFKINNEEFAVFARIPETSPEWHAVSGSAKPTECEANFYLEFCCSSSSGLN